MATVTGLTAARMAAIEAASVVDGDVINNDLLLTRFDGSMINAGSVRGPAGPDTEAALEPLERHLDRLAFNVQSAQFGPASIFIHGALADGNSHPLSNYFGSLAAAQATYPHATALTDELDWAACQKAQDAAEAVSGACYHPRGVYRFGLKPYECGSAVYNFGDGGNSSMLRWEDRGLGNYAVKGFSGQANATHFYHMGFLGPRHAVLPVPGVRSVGMDGVVASSWVHMTDCYVSGFGANILVIDNHQKFTRVRSTFGFMNWLWADNPGVPDNQITTGDQSLDSCTSDFAAWCNVGIHGRNAIVDNDWRSTHLGFAPVGIHKFDTLDAEGYPAKAADVPGAVPSIVGGLVNTNLSKVQFEEQGNACILDESTGGGNGTSSLVGCNIDGCVHTWGNAYRIGALTRDYAVNVRVCRGTRIRGGVLPFGPGELGTYKITTGGLQVTGGHHRHMFSPLGNYAELVQVDNPPYIMHGYVAAAAITNGDILEKSLNGYQVQRYTNGPQPVAGVAAHDAAAGEIVMVFVPPGDAYVLSEVVQYGGMHIIPGGGGVGHRARQALGFGQNQYPHEPSLVPAFAVSKTNGGAAGGALLHVSLIAMRDDPGLVWPQATDVLPEASATYRGQFRFLHGGGATPDTVVVCRYNGAGGWAWDEVTLT